MRWVKKAAVLAAAVAALATMVPAAGAASGAASPADELARAQSCVNALKKAKVGKDGAIAGATPKACTAGVTVVKNLATTPVLSPTVGSASVARAAAVNPCATYTPPTVTITPANPVRGGTYSAVGMNWPKNAPVFGYSIGYFNNGWLAGPFGVKIVNANSMGQWSFNERIDSRRVDYYILKFQSLVCPSATVQLRVNMTPTVQAPAVKATTTVKPTTTTTAKPASKKVATLVSAGSASTPGTAVLGAVATKPATTKAAAKATIQSPSLRNINAEAPEAPAEGAQPLLIGLALAVGVAGWLALFASRRGLLGRRAR